MIRLRTCLIGCGDIGYKFDRGMSSDGALTHFKAINESDDFELIAVAEPIEEIRNEITSSIGIRSYEDHSEMLKTEKPDVIVIASSDDSHIPVIRESIELGPKLIFCEKPLSKTSEEANEVIEACKNSNILLQVNYTRRFLDEFINLGEKLSSGSIGEIGTTVLYYSRGLIHNASHYIDLIIWYFGMPKSVNFISSKSGLENDMTFSFGLEYPNGSEIIFAGLAPNKISFAEICFVGTKGMVKFSHKNEIEYYKTVSNDKFIGYEKYEIKETIPVRFERALPNAYKNIYNAVVNGDDLLSPGSGSNEIFKIVNSVKEKEYV